MLDNNAIQALQDAAGIDQAARAVAQVTDPTTVALPDHFKLHDLEPYMVLRRRARGAMSTNNIDDFLAYAKEHAETGAAVFVNATDMNAVAVLNLGTPELPGHADNRASCKLRSTAAFDALKAHTGGRSLSQRQAAEFLEDWDSYVVCLNEAGMIANKQAVSAIREITIEALAKVDSSEHSLSSSKSAFESVKASAKSPLPTQIRFICAPYTGIKERIFIARLGVMTGEKAPSITLRIINFETHIEEMAAEFASLIRDQSTLPVFVGEYAKG